MRKILLVDDDATFNFISKVVLKSIGEEDVDVALDGKEALDYLKENNPDTMLLDLNMPVMDGWELLEELCSTNSCGDIKIAILSSSTRESDKERAMAHSCVVAFFEKPLTKEQLNKLWP